jgi:phospholipid/cholesterol/gamma-HCH transport system ATP-binding protein
MNNTVVIDVKGLNKSFGDNHVLRDFNMTLKQGENLAILGKSGSGKSVLIKCIIRLLALDDGQITVLSNDITEMSQEDLDQLRARVGISFSK